MIKTSSKKRNKHLVKNLKKLFKVLKNPDDNKVYLKYIKG